MKKASRKSNAAFRWWLAALIALLLLGAGLVIGEISAHGPRLRLFPSGQTAIIHCNQAKVVA